MYRFINHHELLGWKPIKKLDEYVNDFVNNQKMTYYLLLSGDTEKDYHDTNVLGEESFGKFLRNTKV